MTPRSIPRAFVVFLLLFAMHWSSGVSAQGTGLSLTVDLAEYDDSGVSGTAYLVETTDGGTRVSMELRGDSVEGNHPTHIHTGTCADFAPDPLYPLETVDLSPVDGDGVSESDVPGVTLPSLRSGEFVIVVHRSPEQLTEYLVCGDIGLGVAGQAAKVVPAEGAAVAHHMPTAGSGSEGDRPATSAMILAAASASVILLMAGAVRRVYAHQRT